MKPKYRRIAKFLPAIISLSMAATSSAAVFVDDTGGNATPSAADNGATTIIADGGTAANPVVTIVSTIDMTGDPAEDAVIDISNGTYTVNIAAGASLAASGGPTDGIHVDSSSPTTTINNSGTVSGPADGIDFAGDFGVVNNFAGGVITGGETGVEADHDLTVANSGSITGTAEDGINADDRATITNNEGGTISGGDDGVDIEDDGIVTNNGSITGTDNGVTIDNNGLINNNTNFDPNFPFGPISGGSITGGDSGIVAEDNLTVNNQNLATITGNGDDGINADDFAIINNFSGGTITGALSGVQVDDDLILVNQNGATIEGLGTNGIWAPGGDRADITNDGLIRGGNYGVLVDDDLELVNGPLGQITGTLEDGVQSDDGATITNSGSITGGDDGIFVDDNATITNNAGGVITGGGLAGNIGVRVGDDSILTNAGNITAFTGVDAVTAATFALTNSGVINGTGGVAIDGGTGADTLTLNFGSQVIGNVELDAGLDTINFDDGLTSPLNAADGAFSNSILGNVTGVQVINKTGDGIADGVAFIGVPGNGGFDVFADEINITHGGLYINADIDGATVANTQISAGGAALGGTGTWDADIFVTAGGFSAGAIPINLDADPTNSVGGVTVTGDVTHTAGSFIRHDINPQGGGDDLITQTGGANSYDLGGGTDIRIASTDNNRVISDGVYTVVDSENPILGALGTLSVQFNDNVNGADTGFQGSEIFNGSSVTTTVLTNFFTTAAINGTDVELTVLHNYAGLPGFSSNQSSIGAALDASTNSGNALIQDFIAALDNSNLAFVGNVLTDLTTLDSFSTAAAITSSNYQTHRVVQDHLAMTRSQVGEISRSYVGTYSAPAPAPEPSIGNTFNVWGSVSYDWRDSSGFATDIDGEEASFLAGIDYRVAPSFLLGVLLEGSTADYDFSGGGSDVDSFRAAIYGTYGESTGFYADFLVGYGDHDFDSDRNGFLGGLDTDTDAESLQAMLTLGYAMQHGCVKHGPFGGVEYSKVDVDGYSQGGLLPIAIDDYDVESTRLLIGYRAEAEYGRFTPYLSVAYAHELDDDNHSTTGTLPGGATFGIDGGALDSAILISAGTGYTITENLGLNVGYHGEISTGDGIDSHGGTIGLNYAF